MRQRNISDRQIADIVIRIIGEIEPIGDANEDKKRFMSLLKLENTVDLLLEEIYHMLPYKDEFTASMWEIGNESWTWLDEKRQWLDDIL